MPSTPYPSVESYLAELPRGLGSYPQCVAKASVLGDALESRPLHPPAGALPPEILTLVRDPPPVSSWVPETHSNAVLLAILDEHFGAHETAQFDDWVYVRNRRLFRRPLYRILFAVVSPERLLVGAERRWEAFHKGTKLSVRVTDESSATMELHSPPHLFPATAARGIVQAVRAALEAAGAKEVQVELVRRAPTRLDYAARWAR